MSVFYEQTRSLEARDIGLLGQCRPSGVLTLLQEAATAAAGELGWSGPEMLEKYNAIWMVARMWYRLERPLCWGDAVTVRTWHRADQGAALYRDFDLLLNGVPVGEAVSTWVLADVGSRRLLRMSRLDEPRDTGGGALCKDRLLTKLRLPEPMVPAARRAFHYSDTDINGHVNNVKYADAMADGIHLEDLLPGRFVSELQIGYLAECRAGETLELSAAQDGDAWYVHGVDGAGRPRFDGFLRLAELRSEG